jgi:hypothetical protein
LAIGVVIGTLVAVVKYFCHRTPSFLSAAHEHG